MLEACAVLHYSVYVPGGCSLTRRAAGLPPSVTPGHNMSVSAPTDSYTVEVLPEHRLRRSATGDPSSLLTKT